MPGTDTTAAEPAMHQEISRAIGSVWNRYAGSRPADVKTTIRDSRVQCVLNDAVADFDAALEAAASQDLASGDRRLTMYTFRREAIEAVTRITHRRILAFVCDHDAKTNTATETFIVDSPPARSRSIFLARQNLED
jgi:uncharacterized protein YbcI